MPSSRNPGKDGCIAGLPVRSTGRTFAAMDPERVREVVPAAEQHERPPTDGAAHRGPGAVRVRQVNPDDGSEGGSGRR